MQNFITESIHLPEGTTAQIAEVAAKTGETYEDAQRRVVAYGLSASDTIDNMTEQLSDMQAHNDELLQERDDLAVKVQALNAALAAATAPAAPAA